MNMSVTKSTIDPIIKKYFPEFESSLDKAITFNFNDERKHLEKAIHYCVKSSGKRIRPLLTMATEQAFENPTGAGTIIAIAIELIHCYSLIHDDLPAMDNDDFRRGKPTCHKAFGDDIAILTGDVLNTYVFEYLSTQLPKYTTVEKSLSTIRIIAEACGANGMAGGQVLDLKSNLNHTSTLNQLKTIHNLKTGKLLSICFELPAMLSTNDDEVLAKIQTIGTNFGLLFQIIDDILDEKASFTEIGKSPGKDKQQNKLTYPALLGHKESLNEAKYLKEQSFQLLDCIDINTNEIKSIFNYIYEKGAQYDVINND